MTFDEALGTWARTRWTGLRIPPDARVVALRMDMINEQSAFYVDIEYRDEMYRTTPIRENVHTIAREIVNTALGVIA